MPHNTTVRTLPDNSGRNCFLNFADLDDDANGYHVSKNPHAKAKVDFRKGALKNALHNAGWVKGVWNPLSVTTTILSVILGLVVAFLTLKHKKSLHFKQ